MLSKKTKQTNRKFYGKWLYKASFKLDGAGLFRNKSFDEIETFCNSNTDPDRYNSYSIWKRAWNNRESLKEFTLFLKPYDKTTYNLRIEGSLIDVYTNDSSLYNDISSRFTDILRHRFEPSEANISVLESGQNYITVDKLPKGRYNFRVYLLPHKMKGDSEGKQRYLDWLKKQTPKVTCTPSIEKWFLTTDWNWDRRYILVEDESTLLMLKLRNSEVVGRVYNFIVSDK